MGSSIDDHKFNDDLLVDESDQKLAARKYPSIIHVLNHPELQQLFAEYDVPANEAKRKGLKAGLWTVALGFGALAIAAAEILFMHPAGEQLAADIQAADWGIRAAPGVLAGLSGLCGVVSFSIGMLGVLLARRKRDWLHRRLMGESIRQFHFQTLVFRLPQILASLKDDDARSKFLSERKLWLESFKARMVGRLDAVFAAVIQEEGEIDPWLHGGTQNKELTSFWENKDLDPVFKAYRELRILHQLDYANYKLQNDHKFRSTVPRRQLEILSTLTFVSIVGLFVMHVGVLLGAVFPHPILAGFHSQLAVVIIIWLALAALATRAVEQGLQPEREIERYQQYRSSVRAILGRYDEAPSQVAKIQIMREMERLSYDEMRNFLITNERSRFVM